MCIGSTNMAATYCYILCLGVISFGLCVLHCSASKPSNVALGKCMHHDICVCGNKPDYSKCWNTLHEKTHATIIPIMEQFCNMTLNESPTFAEIMDPICNAPLKERRACLGGIVDKGIKHQNKVHSSLDLREKPVALALEQARICMGPLISKCVAFPDTCF